MGVRDSSGATADEDEYHLQNTHESTWSFNPVFPVSVAREAGGTNGNHHVHFPGPAGGPRRRRGLADRYELSWNRIPGSRMRRRNELPYCPRCFSEFVDGTVTCEDCGALLVSERPSGATSVVPEEDLVEVWRAQGELNAQLVRSLLEGSAISSILVGESLRLTHGLTVDGLALVRVLVRREDVRRASELIALSTGAKLCPSCAMAVPADDRSCWSCEAGVDQPRGPTEPEPDL